ncbi:MAG TPA: enoyl-CoA hydratase-related protein [Gemmataceae bacterium]|nr:enoyl-CoA hydratase-related protein [Gemmataceae bacterium]
MSITPGRAVHFTVGPDGVVRVIFDRPNSKANTLSRDVWSELAEVFEQLRARSDLVGVLLTSAKDGIWLAGADVRELAALPADNPTAARELIAQGLDVLAALEALPFPTVALINGACLGGGLELALACDFRVCGSHPKCKLGSPEVKLGVIPGWGGTQRLPRIIGLEQALPIVCLGESLSAMAARSIGLADDVVASERLEKEAIGLLTGERTVLASPDPRRRRKHDACPAPQTRPDLSPLLAALPDDQRLAAHMAEDVMTRGASLPFEEGLRLETDAFVRLVTSPAAKARFAQFLSR